MPRSPAGNVGVVCDSVTKQEESSVAGVGIRDADAAYICGGEKREKKEKNKKRKEHLDRTLVICQPGQQQPWNLGTSTLDASNEGSKQHADSHKFRRRLWNRLHKQPDDGFENAEPMSSRSGRKSCGLIKALR